MGNDLISIDTGDFVLFQSSFPRGERPSSSTRIPFLSQFQSTFPRGERRSKRSDSDYFTDFNPRSRVGNDSINRSYRLRYIISIHVPAWGTTHVQRLRPVNYAVFQSTFPRGERRDSFNTAYNSTNFNPRSRVGNDVATFLPLYIIQISIHVPAWGTTMEELLHTRHFHISIHVPAWGTTQFAEQNINHFQFQSTFPRGERPFAHLFLLLGGLFQSTFPRGERPSIYS